MAAALRLVDALRRPLYVDEALSLSIGVLPIDRAMAFLRSDFHPPLFFIMLHGFESAHAGIWAIRAIMALFGVTSVALLMAIIGRWSNPRAALIAGACAAVMPSLIFYDGWIRMYAPLDTLVLAGFWLVSLAATQDAGVWLRALRWLGWIAVMAAALYTHYLAWMALIAQLVFAATRGRRMAIGAAVAGVAAVALWLPQLPTFEHQLGAGGVSFGWFGNHLAQGVWELPSQATVDPELEGVWAAIAAAVVWLWLACAFAYAWPRSKATILPWLLAPAAITVAYSVIGHKELYDARYYLLLAYGLAASTGVALDRLWEKTTRALVVACVAGAALAAVGCAYAADASFYTTDWPHVADVVRAHAQPSDLLVFQPGAGDWAFQYYFDETGHRVWRVSTPAEIDHAVAQIGREHRVWLIGSGIVGIDPGLRVLHALQQRFKLGYFEESTRILPSQDVQIGLFIRQ